MGYPSPQVLVVVFLATLVRSTFGFGEALVAVPLLALFIPINQAAPLAVALSIAIAAIVVLQDWRQIHLRSALWLLFPTLVSTPLGVALLTSAHPRLVKIVLALVIIAFSAYFLLGRRLPTLDMDHGPAMVLCGLAAGVLGGAYGMNGPPLAIYGSMRRWSPQHFRATLQGYFLPASLMSLAGYGFAGLIVPAVTRNLLWSLPVAVPAVLLGRSINRRLRGEAFLRYVHGGLLCIGLVLLIQAIRRG